MRIGKSLGLCWLVLAFTVPAWGVRAERDDAGRMVTMPDHLHRIVCLAPSITDTVYALGAASEVVGVTDYSFYPPEARQKPSVGNILQPSLEKIVALRPDLVIAVPALNDPESVRGLQRAGVSVFLLNVSSLPELYQAITTLGRLLEREKQATALLAQLRAREQKVRAQGQGRKRPSVFLVLSMDPCITAGRNAFLTELIAAAGADSVTSDQPRDWLQVSLEAIIPKQPDYILLMKGTPFGLKEMQRRAGWNSLNAVRNGRVLELDDRIQYPSPVAFDGLEFLARQLHVAQPR
jgi:ABC-type Fe3+-hydroxamate transport system substrate-binding protein